MFAYCVNNPINKIDKNGDILFVASISGIVLWKICLAIVGIITTFVICDAIAKNPSDLSIRSISKRYEKTISKNKDNVKSIEISKPRRDPIHHIVAKVAPRAAESRKILRSVGIEPITDYRNLVQLPQ